MHYFAPYVLALVVSVVIAITVALFAWRRHVPGALPFAALMLAVAAWSSGAALELTNASEPAKLFWAGAQYAGIVVVPPTWLAFALQYTGRGRLLTRRALLLLAIEPLVTVALVWTNPAHNLIWHAVSLDASGPFPVLRVIYGAGFWAHATYSYLLLLLGALALIRALGRSLNMYRGQTGALLLAVLAPWIANIIYLAGANPFPGLDLTPFAFTITGVAISWGIFRFHLLDIAPVAFRAVVASMADAVIVLDRDSRIMALNPAARRLIQHTSDRVIGQPVGRVLPGWPDPLGHPSDATADMELVFGDGATARSFDLRLSTLADRAGREVGNVVVLHDITERKRMEAALLAQKQLFENLVAVARATSAHPTLAATLQDALDVATRLTGADQGSLFLCDAAGVVTHSILARGETIPEQRQALVRTVLDKGLAGWVIQHRQGALIDDTASDPRWFPLPNPPYTVCSALAAPILSGSVVLGVLTLHHRARGHFSAEHLQLMQGAADQMTLALRNAQLYDEQYRLAHELYQAKEAAETANNAKTEFVSFVSHELKTPMTVIGGYTDVLLGGVTGPVTEMQASFLQTIRTNVNLMTTLVADLIDVARMESGHLKLETSEVRMAEVIDRVVRSTTGQIEAKAQTLTLAIPGDLPPVQGDRTRLIQILTNLVSNAYKYTPQGGQITISAEHAANQWDPAGSPEVVHIAVQDTGLGIRPEDQRKIFQKFFRAEDDRAREASGTGLGLNITRNLVELQGGRIWFESQFRAGTTFHFTIPAPAPIRTPLAEAHATVVS